MEVAVIVAIIGGLASVVASYFTARAATKAGQARADVDERSSVRQIEAGAYERARQVYEGALSRMQTEIDRQAKQIDTLQRQVARLSKQVRDVGLVPATSSEEEDP